MVTDNAKQGLSDCEVQNILYVSITHMMYLLPN